MMNLLHLRIKQQVLFFLLIKKKKKHKADLCQFSFSVFKAEIFCKVQRQTAEEIVFNSDKSWLRKTLLA